jgi:hypothetical protein
VNDREMRAHTNMFRGQLEKLLDRPGGQEAIDAFGLALAIRHEKHLRQNRPDSPLLVILDNYREEMGIT